MSKYKIKTEPYVRESYQVLHQIGLLKPGLTSYGEYSTYVSKQDPIAEMFLSIKKRLFEIFHNEFSLKYFINQNFNMSELNFVEKIEPELAVLQKSYKWRSN